MATTVLKLVNSQDVSAQLGNVSSTSPRSAVEKLSVVIDGMVGGVYPGQILECVNEAGGVQASGTLTISGGSGTVGGSINGVAITVTWATSDTATATALAAAINASANALVAGIVTATSLAGVVTIKGVEKSKLGNSITLTASGTGVTASGARLTGGAAYTFVTLKVGG